MPADRAPGEPAIAKVEAPAAGHLLDIARGIAMAIVLYGHFLEIFFQSRHDGAFLVSAFVQYKVLAAFAMATFFFLSGASAPQLHRKGWRNVLKTSLYLAALAYLAHGLGLGVKLAETIAATGTRDLGEFARDAASATLKGNDFSIVVVWFLVTLGAVRLIAFSAMRFGRAGGWLVLGGLFALCFAIPLVPNVFGLKSWFGGGFFFLLGMLRADLVRKLSGWLWLPLLPLVSLLALANAGCPTDAFAACGQASLHGRSVVWIHVGQIGFVPLFIAAGIAGCLTVLSLARAIADTWAGRMIARLGRRSLDVLIVNGFVLVFLQPHLGALPATEIVALTFPLLPVALVALHLGAVRLLERPLSGLNRLALRLSDLVMAGLDLAASRLRRSGAAVRKVAPADRLA